MARPWSHTLAPCLLVGALTGACSSDETAARQPSIAAQPELARGDWLAHTRRSLRRETCATGARFRRCSDLDRHGCETRMTAALATCSTSLGPTLPARIAAGAADIQARDRLTGCMWHHAAMELGPTRVDMLCLLTSK